MTPDREEPFYSPNFPAPQDEVEPLPWDDFAIPAIGIVALLGLLVGVLR